MLPQCYPARSDRHPPTPSHKLPQHDRPAGHPTDAQHLTITGKPPPTTAAQPRKTRLAIATVALSPATGVGGGSDGNAADHDHRSPTEGSPLQAPAAPATRPGLDHGL